MPLKTNLKDLTPSAQRFKQEIVLPSGGFSNPTAFPNGKITIYPWDMATSEWMSSANKTNELIFMSQLAARLCHLPLETMRTMVSSEVPLIAMVSRALTFTDSRVQYTAVCPYCGTTQPPVHIHIPNDLQKNGEKAPGYTGDQVTLPASGDVVTVRPITVDEEEASNNRSERFQKVLGNAEASILAAVRAVGGGAPDSQDELVKWYHALAPSDSEFLATEVSRLNPGVKTSMRHQCEKKTCAREFNYELNLATDFFRH